MTGEPPRRPVADGGTHTELFESFPDPLLAYACDDTSAAGDDGAASGGDGEGPDPSEGPLVVRRVNPAFEAAFGSGSDDIGGTQLADVALTGSLRSGREGNDSTGAIDDPDPGDPESSGGSGGTDAIVSSPTTTVGSLLERARGTGTGLRFDWKGSGETRHFRVRTVGPGPPDWTGYLVFTDVTGPERERRALEERVEHLERVASVAKHDLRNPLEVARIRLEAARDTGEDVHFEKVVGALDRIEAIARDVLATGGESVDPIDAVALGTVAEAAWGTVDTADATLVTSPGLPTVRGDADRLQGLFENLFRNAVEHGSTSPRSQAREDSVEHGSTSNRAEPDDPVEHGGRGVTVTVEPLADGFAVDDDGPGIPPDVRERAFEAGLSTTPGNSGLGLSIVRRIAREHGWRVSLVSGGESAADDEDGARFEFTGVERIEDEGEGGSNGSDGSDGSGP